MNKPEYCNLFESGLEVINTKKIASLSQSGWKKWMKDRLQGKDLCFPEPAQKQNETYKSLFIELISNIDQGQNRIEKKRKPLMALYELVKEITGQPQKYEEGFMYSILFLFRYFWDEFSKLEEFELLSELENLVSNMLNNESLSVDLSRKVMKQFTLLVGEIRAVRSSIKTTFPDGAKSMGMK